MISFIVIFFIAVFFITGFFIVLKQRWPEWQKRLGFWLGTVCAPAFAVAALATFLVVLLSLGIKYLGSYTELLTKLTNKAETGNWDYLSAAATLIGACISLIPIFWLIEQNRRMSEQLKLQQEQNKLQQEQNNADTFARACAMVNKENSNIEVFGGLLNLKRYIEARPDGYHNRVVSEIIKRVMQNNKITDIDNYKFACKLLCSGICSSYLQVYKNLKMQCQYFNMTEYLEELVELFKQEMQKNNTSFKDCILDEFLDYFGSRLCDLSSKVGDKFFDGFVIIAGMGCSQNVGNDALKNLKKYFGELKNCDNDMRLWYENFKNRIGVLKDSRQLGADEKEGIEALEKFLFTS